MQVIKFASATGFPVLVPPFLLDTLWSILIVRVSPHDGGRPLHPDLKFDFECPRAVRCTWTKWHWKPVHSPYQHPPASCLQKFEKLLSNGSHRTCHELSTFVRWLSHVDIAWLGGLRDGSLRACSSALSHSINAGVGVEPVPSCGNDVGGDVPDELDEQEVPNLGEIISFALSFTLWNSDSRSAYHRSSFPNFSTRVPDVFEESFG